MVYIATDGKYVKDGVVPGTQGKVKFDYVGWHTRLLELCNRSGDGIHKFLNPDSGKPSANITFCLYHWLPSRFEMRNGRL